MGMLLGMLQQLGTVAVIMVCAIGGTIGILKVIKKFTPGNGFPKDLISKKLEKERKK